MMKITDGTVHAALQRWRDEDHEDTVALSREQVIDLCEEYRATQAHIAALTRERDEARSFQWYGTHAERLERRADKAEARIAELMEALEPFANAKITYLDAPDGREVKAKHVHGLVYGDFRRARAALHPEREG